MLMADTVSPHPIVHEFKHSDAGRTTAKCKAPPVGHRHGAGGEPGRGARRAPTTAGNPRQSRHRPAGATPSAETKPVHPCSEER